ncbi:ribosomal protein S18-alanine N-acetyltransferase [Parasphingorhabdus sp.]
MRIMDRSFPSQFGESWNERQCLSMLSLPGTRLMIAVDEQEQNEPVCGFSMTRTIAGEEELLMIAVDPDYQNAGVGRVMLDQLISDAESEQIAAIFLEVRAENPAQHLYRKLGFEKIGKRSGYYTGSQNEKFDAITYRKKL